jgi:hypothetical protein
MEWIVTAEERNLYSKALALGADQIVLSAKESSEVFVETKTTASSTSKYIMK